MGDVRYSRIDIMRLRRELHDVEVAAEYARRRYNEALREFREAASEHEQNLLDEALDMFNCWAEAELYGITMQSN